MEETLDLDWDDIVHSTEFILLQRQQLEATASRARARFLVNTGHNLYYCGTHNALGPQIKADFEDVYGNHASLRVPWYSALGSHE